MSKRHPTSIASRAVARPKAALSSSASRSEDWILWVCFFSSGLTALVYEVLWTRMITNVIGGAPFAVAIVLTIFMGGIGAGSHLAGRLVDRQNNRAALVRIYGWLELIISGFAFLVPLLALALQPVYAWLYQQLFQHFLLYNFLVFLGCCLTLAVPALCMGATLPVLCRYQIRDLRATGRSTGFLYGLNTAGAALGALLGGLWLIPRLGVWGTMAAVATSSAIIGAIALWLGRKMDSGNKQTAAVAATASPAKIVSDNSQRRFILGALLIFSVSGFCSMSYEVIWTKLLALIVGPTNYSFTIILVTFILGLALGSLIFGRWGDRVSRPERLLIATQLAAGLFALGVSQLLGQSQMFFAKLTLVWGENFVALQLLKAAALFLFIGVPTICLGAAFPLVGKICSRHLDHVGRSIGVAYALNSLGAVLGSFTAGFVLVPLLGKEHGLGFVVTLQLAMVLIAAWLFWPRLSLPRGWSLAGLSVALAGLAGAQFYPRWNHLVLASSKYHRLEGFAPLLRTTGWAKALFQGPTILSHRETGELVFYGEGIGGFTTVLRSFNSLGSPEFRMANSGKFDASSRGDMNTQVLSAHIPMSLHPAPRSALIIGLASGVTAGEALHYPIEQMDILEINEQVAKGSEPFAPWNNAVLSDPRTRLIIQDARAHLCLSPARYDVIISEPSNPWMAGCAALFTHDFFERVKDRLNEDGCFALWMQTYQIDWASVALIGRTFVDVFPTSALISTHPAQVGSDYLLLGFKGQNLLAAPSAFTQSAGVKKSGNLVLKDPRLFDRFVIASPCAETFGSGPLNSDNRPLLEFSAPRQMHLGRESASEVIGQLLRHRTVPDRLRQSVASSISSADARLEYAELALSIYEPFEGMFDVSKMNAPQAARFANILEAYCRSNEIDLAMIPAGPLRDLCVSNQLEILQRRAAVAGTNEQTLSYRADLHKAAGHNQAALADYAASAQLNPLNVRALNEAGILLCEANKLNEGMEYLRRALDVEPRQTEAHVNLGTAYYNAANAPMAQFHFNEALRIDPTQPQAQEGLRALKRSPGKRKNP